MRELGSIIVMLVLPIKTKIVQQKHLVNRLTAMFPFLQILYLDVKQITKKEQRQNRVINRSRQN